VNPQFNNPYGNQQFSNYGQGQFYNQGGFNPYGGQNFNGGQNQQQQTQQNLSIIPTLITPNPDDLKKKKERDEKEKLFDMLNY